MIKTCYLLKEKLTNVVYEYGCKMKQKNRFRLIYSVMESLT